MKEECLLTILLVEDDQTHAFLVKKNLRRGGFENNIITIDNGEEALEFLFAEGRYIDRPLPDPLLVLLDLNMPGINGYQVLERMKANPATSKIPVIVLTTTDEPREINRCYELGCNLYITKPVDNQAFTAAVRELGFLFCVIAPPSIK